MNDNIEKLATKKEVLRIALDKNATQAFAAMSEQLKTPSSFVRFSPSMLVSFIVSDFFETYFDTDIDVLVAEFFDSHDFLANETKAAKESENYEEAVRSALAKAKKIKSKKRKKMDRKKSKSINSEYGK